VLDITTRKKKNPHLHQHQVGDQSINRYKKNSTSFSHENSHILRVSIMMGLQESGGKKKVSISLHPSPLHIKSKCKRDREVKRFVFEPESNSKRMISFCRVSQHMTVYKASTINFMAGQA
jgi:hypothetical protein